MDKSKQEIIERVTKKYIDLAETKQMYILGIMEGIELEKELREKKSA